MQLSSENTRLLEGSFATRSTLIVEANLAARLCGEANDGQILISPRIYSKLAASIEAEPVGELTLKGFHRPVLAHNVLAVRPEGAPS